MTTFETEIYTYTYKQIFEGLTKINLCQLKENNYDSLIENDIIPLKNNSGINNSYYYSNRILYSNKTDNEINSLFLLNLKNDKGSIIFLLNPNIKYFSVKDKYITKPVFTAGFYLGKNIEIIVEVLQDEDKTRQISIVFL
jgi:hypothetical protein